MSLKTLDEIIQATLQHSKKKLIAAVFKSDSIMNMLDTPEWRERRRLERLEYERIQAILDIEYGPHCDYEGLDEEEY